jgi:hypothetical protein
MRTNVFNDLSCNDIHQVLNKDHDHLMKTDHHDRVIENEAQEAFLRDLKQNTIFY